MTPSHMVGRFVVGAFVVLAAPALLPAQSGPPVRGTIALEGTTQKVYAAAHIVIVKTIDGIEHAFRFTRDLLVHGGKGEGVNALVGLREGTTVVVHYTADDGRETLHEVDRIGDEGLKISEGMVTDVDRRHKQIVVRFDNGSKETFRLTNVVVDEVGVIAGPHERVVVYYSEEGAEKVAHYFKKVS